MNLYKLMGLISMVGGLVATLTDSQVLAIAMLTDGLIVTLWYLKEG